ncbi:ABCA9 [Symbiodinium sp. KB8]|nr:ABCA9 [Symbiodinium sp. KB8]
MKRKLSVAIALIGHSQMLFMDEPTAAVDAGAKRHLWKVINKRASDQTVVLTTHSMEEAEALSSRMAIQAGFRGFARAIAATAL